MLLVIVCLVLLGLLTLHGGRRTAFGDEIVTQAMSYRRFLRRVTQSQLLSRLAQDSQYFYRILPYAEAIGLGAGLARTLGNTELEQCDWYQEQQPLPRTAAGFYSHLQEALALLELSTRKKNATKRACRSCGWRFFHAITAPYAGSSGRIRRTARLSPPYTA